MSKKLTSKQSKLYKRIDEVLFYVWDPIGINDSPYARDEYHSYIPIIFTLAQKKDCTNEIAEYLNSVQMVTMGLGSDVERCKRVADYIFEWSEYLGFQD